MPTLNGSSATLHLTVTEDEAAPAVPSTGLRSQLVMIGNGHVASHPLPEVGLVALGRAPDNDIVLDDPSISRQHALLRLGPTMMIEDLQSANGTRVRGAQLSPRNPTTVGPGELIELGRILVLVQQHTAAPRPRRIWTHGYFEARIEDECLRAQRTASWFALMRVHCDAGMMPSLVEETLAEILRPLDVVGAYAPGEFEVLLVNTTPEEVDPLVARMATRLAHRGASVRTGIACYPRDGQTPDALEAHACALARDGRITADPHPSRPVADGAMRDLHRLVERIAPGMISVLILGETGVGKEVLAETVHRLSPRAGKPLLRLNCAALSETLLESELFGHERGSFTGAGQAKPGLLETAQGGTVLLDEVGDLPMPIQVKLLRVIEERKVLRVGGLVPRQLDVRFVAATNRDLETEVERGTFRQDLYFRINGISLVLPPLRQRVSEIAGLTRDFVAQACRALARQPNPGISREAMLLLERYAWPGNIRELRNVVERAVLLCSGGSITPEHLPIEKMTMRIATPPAAPAATPLLDDGVAEEAAWRQLEGLHVQQIHEALRRCAGNQTAAAKLLGISRRTLVTRLSAYGIPRPRKKIPLPA